MNFYIEKIQLWFRNGATPVSYVFEPDKVNVVRGTSSTGKSSIMRIIDYCLLSQNVSIVEDVINENTSWYGLVFSFNGNKYTVIRKAPRVEGTEMDVIFEQGEYLPLEPKPTEQNLGSVTVQLNELFATPKITITMGKMKNKLSFRHLLLFNFLTEDIIASANTYLDARYFGRDYERILDMLIDLILGSNSPKEKELSEKVENANKGYTEYEKSLDSQIEKEKKRIDDINNIAQKCHELGLSENTDIGDDLQEVARVIRDYIEYITNGKQESLVNKEADELYKEIKEISQTLQYYKSLNEECNKFSKKQRQKDDSLAPLVYIQQHMEEILVYDETSRLLKCLQEAWIDIKKRCDKPITPPRNFEKRRQTLQELLLQKKSRWERLTKLAENNRDLKWMYEVVTLQKQIEEVCKQTIGKKTEAILIQKHAELEQLTSALSKIRAKNQNKLGLLNSCIKKYFDWQTGISESYNGSVPLFDLQEQQLLLDKQNSEMPKKNIGSKSNYMFLHLCFFLGLHDMLMSDSENHILNFLFIDQPSIPYYGDLQGNDEVSSEDKTKLKSAFSLIDRFMRNRGDRHFQIILIEHAPEDYWKKEFDTFITKYEFTKGDGLIPKYVLEYKS